MSSISNPRPPISYNPELTFETGIGFLELKDVWKVPTVCKFWCNRMDSHGWKKLFDTYGIPLIEGEPRNYRIDFKYLYPITTSGYKIGKYFGRIVGNVPSITQEELDKFKGRNFRVVVIPNLIRRTIDQTKTPLTLDEQNNLTDISNAKTVKEGDITIPFGPKNLIFLSNLKENKNAPVFTKGWQETIDQCNTCASEIFVYLMEYNIAEETRNRSFKNQKAYVKREGFEVTPLLPRALFDAVEILETGKCPDGRDPMTFVVRNSNIVRDADRNLLSSIMVYAGKVSVNYCGPDDVGHAVVRGWPCGSSQSSGT